VDGTYAYLAENTIGLRVIDISNPALPKQAGFFNTFCYAYAVAMSGDYIYVADHEDGLYIIQFNEPTDIRTKRNSDLPGEFVLAQNYPNPFNPTTAISYHLSPQGGISDVTLTIYNVQGQAIRTLVHTKQTPGAYQTVWDGLNDEGLMVSSGVYLYRLRAGTFVETKKMILAR